MIPLAPVEDHAGRVRRPCVHNCDTLDPVTLLQRSCSLPALTITITLNGSPVLWVPAPLATMMAPRAGSNPAATASRR
jgi:hypothetical protein